MSGTVEVKKEGHVTEIWIDREESLNAINYEMLRDLRNAVKEVRAELHGDNPSRVVFIRGKGRAFIAGADIKVMYNNSWEQVAQFIRLGQRLMRELEDLPLPVVGVVDGFALGGGLEVALACDLILLTDKATIGQPEVGLGIIPGFGGTQRLAQRLGVGRAKRLIFTGETLKAKEAFDIGLGEWLVEHDKLEDKIKEISVRFNEVGPLAIASSKRAIWKGYEQSLLAGLTKEVDEFLESFNTADAREGLSAFVEKRKPNFKAS